MLLADARIQGIVEVDAGRVLFGGLAAAMKEAVLTVIVRPVSGGRFSLAILTEGGDDLLLPQVVVALNVLELPERVESGIAARAGRAGRDQVAPRVNGS